MARAAVACVARWEMLLSVAVARTACTLIAAAASLAAPDVVLGGAGDARNNNNNNTNRRDDARLLDTGWERESLHPTGDEAACPPAVVPEGRGGGVGELAPAGGSERARAAGGSQPG